MMEDDLNDDEAVACFSADEYHRLLDIHCLAKMFAAGLHHTHEVCSDEKAFKTIHSLLGNVLYGNGCKSADVVVSRLLAKGAICQAYFSSRNEIENDKQIQKPKM